MRQRAFTLIELLVVIAIIAVLAGILFPVFAQARDKARQSTCTSNARQYGTAVALYMQDFEEWFPFAQNYWGPGTYTVGSLSYASTNGLVPPPIYLAPYVKNFAVFSCPSSPRRLPTSGIVTDSTALQTYGWNWYITYYPKSYPPYVNDASRSGPRYTGQKLGEIQKPADTVLLGESDPDRIQGGFCYPHTNDWGARQSSPWKPKPWRHAGGDLWIFTDGHAKWFKGESIREMAWNPAGQVADLAAPNTR